jgi:hypothetical protein
MYSQKMYMLEELEPQITAATACYSMLGKRWDV